MYGTPILNIARAGPSLVELSWAPEFVGATVQSSMSLEPGSWVTLGGVPALSGGLMRLTNSATAPFQFFRLFQP
jgi:hypothetical protein